MGFGFGGGVLIFRTPGPEVGGEGPVIGGRKAYVSYPGGNPGCYGLARRLASMLHVGRG